MVKIADSLYQTIVASMPIVCVDLIIRNSIGHVLLLKRCNAPAKDQWWFPGGRVLMNEYRSDAARRKAQQECGLVLTKALNLRGTYELFFNEGGKNYHSVTTLFETALDNDCPVILDAQSKEFIWVNPLSTQENDLHKFITSNLIRIEINYE